MSTGNSLEQCVARYNQLKTEIETAIGFDDQSDAEVRRPCFPGFKLSRDIPEQLQNALRLMGGADLSGFARDMDDVETSFRCKRCYFLQKMFLVKTPRPFDILLAELRALGLGKKKLGEVEARQDSFCQAYTFGLISDINQASREYWEIVDLCAKLKWERQREVDQEATRRADKGIVAQQRHRDLCQSTAGELLQELSGVLALDTV